MNPLMPSDMSLTRGVHYICSCHKKPIGMVFILRSVCAFCSFHFQFALLFLKVHWGLLHLSIWFLSLSSYCNLLPLVIYHYAFLYSFMWFCMVAAASRNKLPASEGISYLFFFEKSPFENTCFSCIYDAKLFCPSLLWAMKNACFNLPYMLCCSFFLSVIYATYCALPCTIQHKVARWVSATHALQ